MLLISPLVMSMLSNLCSGMHASGSLVLLLQVSFEKDIMLSDLNEYEILQLLMGDCRERLQAYNLSVEEEIKYSQVRGSGSHRHGKRQQCSLPTCALPHRQAECVSLTGVVRFSAVTRPEPQAATRMPPSNRGEANHLIIHGWSKCTGLRKHSFNV